MTLTRPAHVAEWSENSAAMCRFAPRPRRVAYQKIISRNTINMMNRELIPGR